MKRLRLFPFVFFLSSALLWAGERPNKLSADCGPYFGSASVPVSQSFRENILELNFGSINSIQRSKEALVPMLKKVTLNKRRAAESAKLYRTIEKVTDELMDKFQEQFFSRLERDPTFAEAFRRYVASNLPRNYRYQQLYGQLDSPRRYEEYVSLIQQYVSTVMLGYAAVRTDIPYDKPLTAFDIGTGVGDTISVFKRIFEKAVILGYDKSFPMLNRTVEKFPDVIPMQGDFTKGRFPIEDNTIKAATVICSLGQYATEEQILAGFKDLFRGLEPGGIAVTEYAPWTRTMHRFSDIRKYQKELRKLGYITERLPMMQMDIGGQLYSIVVMQKPWDIR